MNWLRAMVVEIFAIPAILLLQLFGFFWKPKLHCAKKGTPILLVHGYVNTSAVWLYLKWKIKGLGPIYAIDLKGPFHSIVDFAKQVDQMANEIETQTGKKELILVAYSMGGLVSAYYATHFAPKGKVQKIITISTPFSGTHVAQIAIGKNAKEMLRNSPFLKKLNRHLSKSACHAQDDDFCADFEFGVESHIETKWPRRKNKRSPKALLRHNSNIRVPITTIASKTDEIVIPYTSALIDGAKQVLFDNLGHAGLVFSPRVASVLINEIKLQKQE